MTDFRTDSAPDVTLRTAMENRAFFTYWNKKIDVHLRWIDDLSLEYAVAPRTAYETNVSHSAMCRLKARLPIDRAMAWTRQHRMAARRVWVTTQPNPENAHDLICSHRIVFKNANHAFEFKMMWC